jgi:hypothetical protein
VRSLARTPETVRWVRRYSSLGEHAAVWLALGGAAIAMGILLVSRSDDR